MSVTTVGAIAMVVSGLGLIILTVLTRKSKPNIKPVIGFPIGTALTVFGALLLTGVLKVP